MMVRRAFSSCSFVNFQAVSTLGKFMADRKKVLWYMRKEVISKESELKYKNALESLESSSIILPENDDNKQPISSIQLVSNNKVNSTVDNTLSDVDKKIVYIGKLFNSGYRVALKIYNSYSKLEYLSIDELERRISYLDSKNVGRSGVQKFPWLMLDSPEYIEMKAEKIVDDLDLDFEAAVFLIKIKRIMLDRVKILWDEEKRKEEEFTRPDSLYRNRVDYLAHRLECKPWRVTQMLCGKPALMEEPFDRLRLVLRILLDEALVHPRSICDKPVILLADTKMLEGRIKLLQEHNIKNISASTLHQSEQQFNFYISEIQQRQSISAPYASLIQFLREKLKCDEYRAKLLVTDFKGLRQMEHSDIERKIEKLLAKGLNLGRINSVAGVLCEKDSVIEELYDGLKAINIPESELLHLYYWVLKRKYSTNEVIAMHEDFNDEDDF